jgi:hypothetical protein
MNADASAGVSVQARAGATVPALGTLAWTVLGIGIAVTLIGVLIIVLAARSGRGPARAVPQGPPPPAQAPAAWIPPPRQAQETDVPDPARPGSPGPGGPPD